MYDQIDTSLTRGLLSFRTTPPVSPNTIFYFHRSSVGDAKCLCLWLPLPVTAAVAGLKRFPGPFGGYAGTRPVITACLLGFEGAGMGDGLRQWRFGEVENLSDKVDVWRKEMGKFAEEAIFGWEGSGEEGVDEVEESDGDEESEEQEDEAESGEDKKSAEDDEHWEVDDGGQSDEQR
ncbi:MAG: hypothetical protein L6R42_010617 [Xanthoria sp. 1 TBL-2021]|nr:MAG: hypothetical protein L6R42_010617 [Xanthoria sp. 1 TBL-2021]